MNKKLKRILATISAITLCTVSVISTYANAEAFTFKGDKYPNQYTTSFTLANYDGSDGVKYTFWQAGTDYYGQGDSFRVFISEPITDVNIYTGEEITFYDTMFVHTYMISDGNGGKMPYTDVYGGSGAFVLTVFYSFEGDVNEGKLPLVEEYLLKNSISYTKDSDEYSGKITRIEFDADNLSCDEIAELATKIRKYAGWSFEDMVLPADAVNFNITDVVNELPEPTLSGDTNCDDDVTIADTVLIMQNIANPDEYKITLQGMANADVTGDGDGITLSDAFVIQEMSLNK